MAIIKIPDGNAFKLRVTAVVNSVPADLNVVTNMIVNFVRRGRYAQPHGIDSNGKLVISNDGSLARGIYGVEITGYHDGKPWRHYIKDAFKIVDENEEADQPTTVDDVPIYDLSDNMNFGGDGVTAEYVNSAISAHDSDENAHPDLQQMITQSVEELREEIEEGLVEAGKVNDVEVNGQTVLDPVTKKASITIPEKVSDLPNDAQYQNESQVDAKVAAASVNEVNVSVDNTATPGQPSAENTYQNGVLDITFKNVKGAKGDPLTWDDLTDTQKASLKGAQGDSFQPIEDVSGLVLAHVLGDDNSKAMSQQGVSEQVLVRDYIVLDDPNSVEVLDNKRLNNAASGPDIGKWVSSDGAKCWLIPVKAYKKMAFLTNEDGGTYYAFLLDDGGNRNAGTKVNFADGYSACVHISDAQKLVYLDVPSNATLLYFMCKVGGGNSNNYAPSFVAYVEQAKEKIVAAESKIDNILLRPLEDVTEFDYSFSTAGKWGTSTTYKHARIAVKEGEKYVIQAPPAKYAYYAFVTSSEVSPGNDIPIVSGTDIGRLNYRDETVVTIPKGCKYLVLYNASNARPFNISKVDVGDRTNVKTISPKMMLEAIDGLSGDFIYNTSSTYLNIFKDGKMCATPRFIKTSDDFQITTLYRNHFIRVFFYDEGFEFLGYEQYPAPGTGRNEEGTVINVHFDQPFSYVKIGVRHLVKTETNGYDEPFKLASLRLTGNFPDDWDTYNPLPNDEGYKRMFVMANVTNSFCTNDESDDVQDQATYKDDYGLIALPSTYSNIGEPTRLIIYCHGSGTHFSSNSTRFDDNSHVDPTYWLAEGYAIMDMDGYDIDDVTSHAFAPQAMDCYTAGYQWAIEHYNLKRDGVFLGGRSMGGGNTLNLLRMQCQIPVIAACANLPTSLAMNKSKSSKEFVAEKRGYEIPSGFAWSTGEDDMHPYNQEEIDVILLNWNKFITWWSITSLIIDFPTDETWRRDFIASCGKNNTDRIPLMKDLHAIAKAPLKMFSCWQDPNNWPSTAAVLYKQIMSNSGQIAELRMFNTDEESASYNPHYYELRDQSLRTTATTIRGESVGNVPVVYVEMLQFWRRYEQSN